MSRRNGLQTARAQIVWIAALVGSTALVVHLERLDLGQVGSGLSANPFAAPGPEAADDLALAQQITALAIARTGGGPGDAGATGDGADQAATASALLAEAETRLAQRPDPLLRAAADLLTQALGD